MNYKLVNGTETPTAPVMAELTSFMFIHKRTLVALCQFAVRLISAPFGPTHPSLARHIFTTRFAFSFQSLFTWSKYHLLPEVQY